MKEALFICAVAATFVFGYFLMKKLDVFLESNRRQVSDSSDRPLLRLAFEDLLIVESVSSLLESFSKKNPDCKLHLFSGSAEEIMEKLTANELDFGFFITESICASDKECASVFIPLKQSSLISEAVGLPVEPLETEEAMVKIIWRAKGCSGDGKRFAEQISRFSQKEQGPF